MRVTPYWNLNMETTRASLAVSNESYAILEFKCLKTLPNTRYMLMRF